MLSCHRRRGRLPRGLDRRWDKPAGHARQFAAAAAPGIPAARQNLPG